MIKLNRFIKNMLADIRDDLKKSKREMNDLRDDLTKIK